MLHVKHHLRPKTELLLRRTARATCLVGAGLVTACMAGECLMLMLASDMFVSIMKVVAAVAVSLMAVYFFLWAI